MSGSSKQSEGQQAPRRFWVGSALETEGLTAGEVLEAFERGEIDGATPLRVAPDASPRPLARWVRELVWMAHRERAVRVRVRESLFETAFEEAPIGVVLTDLSGHITRANAAFGAMLARAPAELVGVPVRSISAPDERGTELTLGNQLIAGKRASFQLEKSFVAADGSRVHTLTAISLVTGEGGEPLSVLAHVVDLRGEKELLGRVEAQTLAWRESEERFERMFRFAPQAMVMVDRDQRVLQSNLNAQQLFGYSASEMQGLELARLVPPELRERHADLVSSHYAGGSTGPMRPGRDVLAMRRDGTSFAASIGLVPVSLGGARVVLAGITDVNEERETRRALEESLREKETLLKEIHHRVKNNLQVIGSLLALQSDSLQMPEARTALAESVHRIRSIALIHQQLYGLESLARIDLGAYATELSHSLRAAFAPDARVEVETQAVEVTVDQAVPIGLVLNELVTNALKYGVGGEHARSRGWDVRVTLRALESGELELCVADGGPGLPEPFGLRRSPTLGMKLVGSLARQLRAKVEFENDGGARVVLRCAAR